MDADYYTAYGLLVYSEVALPHFGPGEPGQPDVVIRFDSIPSMLPAPKQVTRHWQAAPDDFLLVVSNKYRFRVIRGAEILVQCLDGNSPVIAADYLVSSIWTALLQQRGFLTLHASSVWTESGAVLFLGNSGAGKSTLATAMVARGFKFLTDDVAAVKVSAQGQLSVIPGYPNLRLSHDALDRLGISPADARNGAAGVGKYLLPAEHSDALPCPVHCAFVLSRQHTATLEFVRLKSREVFHRLMRFTHRHRYVYGLGVQQGYFETLKDTAREITLVDLMTPPGRVAPHILAKCIENYLAEP